MTTTKDEHVVYVSGPISGHDIAEAKARFERARQILNQAGYEHVLTPFDVVDREIIKHDGEQLITGIKHPLLDVWSDIETLTERQYWIYCMARCFTALYVCNAICMLPGWEKSRGAKDELAVARNHGYTVMFGTPNILAGEK